MTATQDAMHALTVRWSLDGLPVEVADELGAYVGTSSYDRFAGMDGLRFKTWRMRRGEWFEGCYVFETSQAREAFEASFRDAAGTSPVSEIVGAGPVVVEPCEVVAVAEGGSGFLAAPTYR